MPFSYKCQSPACEAKFESLTPMNRCPTCYIGTLKPDLDEAIDTFPAPGGPIAAPVVRYSNLASSDTLQYKVTDEKNRALSIIVNPGRGEREITVPAGRVVQNPAGELEQWSLLNKNGQPDWAHFGSTQLQQALKNINDRRMTRRALPRSVPIYLRLGFQNRNSVHSGFGFIHILFSHNRKSFDAVAADMQKVLTATIGMDKSKGQGRIFSSGSRFLLTCEQKGGKALQLVVDERDGIYNFITMYEVTVKDLMSKSTSGDLRLLYPYNFAG
jgi:hypothetical protein